MEYIWYMGTQKQQEEYVKWKFGLCDKPTWMYTERDEEELIDILATYIKCVIPFQKNSKK